MRALLGGKSKKLIFWEKGDHDTKSFQEWICEGERIWRGHIIRELLLIEFRNRGCNSRRRLSPLFLWCDQNLTSKKVNYLSGMRWRRFLQKKKNHYQSASESASCHQSATKTVVQKFIWYLAKWVNVDLRANLCNLICNWIPAAEF